MLRMGLLTAILLSALSTASFAQGGRSAQENACGSDVRKLCRKVMDQGDGAIHRCLQQNRKKLSARCRAILPE